MMAKCNNACAMTTTGMTTTIHLDQLTQSLRLGARVALPQQQTQRNEAFLTARHTLSRHYFICWAAPERAVQPLAPTQGAISPLRVTLGLPTRSSVDQQLSTSEGREPVTESRQPRRAALRQRKLMKSLLHDDLL